MANSIRKVGLSSSELSACSPARERPESTCCSTFGLAFFSSGQLRSAPDHEPDDLDDRPNNHWVWRRKPPTKRSRSCSQASPARARRFGFRRNFLFSLDDTLTAGRFQAAAEFICV